MKKIVIAMVVLAGLAVSLSATNICKNVPAFDFNTYVEMGEDGFLKIMNKNLKDSQQKYLKSISNVGAAAKHGHAQAMDKIAKMAGVSTQIEISTSTGFKRTFDAMALVSAKDNYIKHLLKKYEDDELMFSKFFSLTTKLPLSIYNTHTKEETDNKVFRLQIILNLIAEKKVYDSFWNVGNFISQTVISDSKLSHLDIDYQDFLYAILIQDYKTADEIVANVKFEDSSGFDLMTVCSSYNNR